MKVLIVLVLISVCESCQPTVKSGESNKLLPIPYPKHIVIDDGDQVTVAWDPVEASKDNPILGIKVKLWEPEMHIVYKVNDTELVETWEPIKKNINELPRHKPAFEAVLPPDALNTTFVLLRGVDYEIRAQTFNKHGDGPLSGATGIMLHKKEGAEDY